jgi:hypothetical protein
VPQAPAEVNPGVPAPLSAIILHLLEKEPDHRYQSADGLVYDLERVRRDPAAVAIAVGERDFPVQVDTLHGEGTDTLRVQIRDDGRGGATLTGGTGLLGLKDRIEALGGRIHLDSPPDAGTTLRLELPITTTNGDTSGPFGIDGRVGL